MAASHGAVLAAQDSCYLCTSLSDPDSEEEGTGGGERRKACISIRTGDSLLLGTPDWKGSSGHGVHFFSTPRGTLGAWDLSRITQQVSD